MEEEISITIVIVIVIIIIIIRIQLTTISNTKVVIEEIEETAKMNPHRINPTEPIEGKR